jgi:hypothetical protein
MRENGITQRVVRQSRNHRHLDGPHNFTCLYAESGEAQNAITFRIDEGLS